MGRCSSAIIPLSSLQNVATTRRASVSAMRRHRASYSYRLPATNALKSLSLEVPTAFTE